MSKPPVDISNGTKLCPKCRASKPLNEFGSTKYTKTGITVYCKGCMAQAARDRRATPEGKQVHRESTLRWMAKLPGEKEF